MAAGTHGEGPEGDLRETPVDELRERLRILGYLDAGVDRFVLGPARATRGAVAIAVLASVRIGVLGALLLGPAAAIAVGDGLPGLVTGMRDRVVMALYMAALFGGAITAAALGAGLLVALAARRAGRAVTHYARRVAVLAGGLIGGACLVYLTLLWTAVRGADAAALIGLSTGAALIVAVGISLLLGHAVMLSALALVVAGTGAPIAVKGVPGASWRAMLGAGALAFGGALALSTAGPRDHADHGQRQPLTVVPSGTRVRLFAIDGFAPAVFSRLAAAGRVPALSLAFKGAGAQLTLTETGHPDATGLDPARVWTTVATAQPAAVHGVRTLETRRVAGVDGALHASEGSALMQLARRSTDLLRLTRPSVASGSQRREKTFWEVADEAGLRTSVVNWWATWPVVSGSGIVLSDRATLRLERGGTLDGEIHPAAVYEMLQGRWPELPRRAAALASEAVAGATGVGAFVPILERSATIDALSLLLARSVSGPTTDLDVTFLTGLDIVQRALAGGRQDHAGRAAADAALEAYYVALDTLLASHLRPGSQDLVMVVTSPGRDAARPGGRLMMSGRGARAADGSASARASDVGPTVLYALGVPISEALDGAPLLALFDPPFVQRHPVRRVPSYGARETAAAGARGGQPLDQEVMDRLRSLGYVR